MCAIAMGLLSAVILVQRQRIGVQRFTEESGVTVSRVIVRVRVERVRIYGQKQHGNKGQDLAQSSRLPLHAVRQIHRLLRLCSASVFSGYGPSPWCKVKYLKEFFRRWKYFLFYAAPKLRSDSDCGQYRNLAAIWLNRDERQWREIHLIGNNDLTRPPGRQPSRSGAASQLTKRGSNAENQIAMAVIRLVGHFQFGGTVIQSARGGTGRPPGADPGHMESQAAIH